MLSGEKLEMLVILTFFHLWIWWNIKFSILDILQNSLPVSSLTNFKFEFLEPRLDFGHGYVTTNPCHASSFFVRTQTGTGALLTSSLPLVLVMGLKHINSVWHLTVQQWKDWKMSLLTDKHLMQYKKTTVVWGHFFLTSFDVVFR